MLTTIQRCITSELLRVFLMVMLVNTGMMTFIGVFQQANEWGLDLGFMLQLIPFILPTMLPFTIPAALLLTTSIVYSRLSSDNEIVAIKAAGISPGTAILPALLIGVTTSLLTFSMMDQTIPWSARVIQKTITLGMEEIVIGQLKSSHQFQLGTTSIFVSDVQEKTLIHPVFQLRVSRGATYLTADKALLSLDAENNLLDLTLENAYLEQSDGPDEKNRVYLQGTQHFSIQLPSLKKKQLGHHLTGKELDNQLAQLALDAEMEKQRLVLLSLMGLTQANFERIVTVNKSSQSTKIQKNAFKLLTEKHGRYAMAASCLLFALTGSLLATLLAAKHYLMSFLTCFLPIVLVYYPIVFGTIGACRSGILDPRYAVWTGNSLMFIVTCYLTRKVLWK